MADSIGKTISRSLAVFIFSFIIPSYLFAASVINVTFSVVNGQQRYSYQKIFEEFERLHPEYKVNLRIEAAETYKTKVENWLKSRRHSDVMAWFGGERLNGFIEKGWIRPINQLWKDEDWYQRFTLTGQSSVRSGDSVYGIPMHYYHWGIYYRKSLFEKFDLDPPKTWQEFLRVCQTLKNGGVVPIALGSKEYWPLAGWFDYLNLRANGLPVHEGLVKGHVGYSDPKIQKVFDHWKMLVERGYFLPEHETLTWRDALPYLYRNLAGMMLMGNFWTSQIPDSMRDDFSLFRFPSIDPDIPYYEEAPTDIMFIPENVQNINGAKKVLAYLSNVAVLNTLNNELGMLAPQNLAQPVDDHFLNIGLDILSAAEGASQFYDRDNPKPIATQGMKLMQQFVLDPKSLSEVTEALERLRLNSFPKVMHTTSSH